ncbi:hypothetical protein PSU4_23000 [Pseudonocardia sulfidoxydans NBRC 16205]|uniref:Uncharacterized protein n=1 Tax=Pseudonocardia sulfidoxydans NBRC 16205 TaxID=1223511 RepID=A0A511DEY3_9PSEU|nr:hypothetical protein [Pseudonocardia sulfidoxydans]GEL23346.1 hypothetical protein PSU4_23000 [Pseudonocardia sulfidoxydans NBRC 16205]
MNRENGTVTAMDDPGRKLSEALRARAGQTSGNPFAAPPQPGPVPRPPAPLAPAPGPQASGRYSPAQQSMQQPPAGPSQHGHEASGMWSQQAVNATGAGRGRRSTPRSPMNQVGWALTVALLGGAVLGCALALLSVLVPGLLPPLG